MQVLTKKVVGAGSAIAVGVMIAGFGAVPAQAASSQIVPIETVTGAFAAQTHLVASETLRKDGKIIDAGPRDLNSAEYGTFTWTEMNPGSLPSLESGQYQYNLAVSTFPTSDIVPVWLACSIKDRDTGKVLAENRVENSGRVTCDYTIP